jgi:hypothetical protein
VVDDVIETERVDLARVAASERFADVFEESRELGLVVAANACARGTAGRLGVGMRTCSDTRLTLGPFSAVLDLRHERAGYRGRAG